MRDRAGRGGLGCLFSIILLVVLGYLGTRFIPPYMRYGQFRDAMQADARFATTMADSLIRSGLVADVDSLGLPPEAKRIRIRRTSGRPPKISISAEYTERVTLPIFGVKELHFKPSAEAPI